jgi:release factor glutamine methyltransferase
VTYQECASGAARRLEQAGLAPDDARIDAAVLARAALGWDTARWLAEQRMEAPAAFAARFDESIARRARREPVAYITGTREFFGRPFLVTPAVLIPRPETEVVVTSALACLDEIAEQAPLVVDVGTGSGCLAITLAAERPGLRVVGTDVSASALQVAAANASRLGVSSRVTFREAQLLSGVDERPHLIVSNPPYVCEADRAVLPPDVARYEPALALFAGADGLDVIRALVDAASRSLMRGGRLVVEFGAGQAEAVRRLIDDAEGLELRAVLADLASRPRVVVAARR